MGHVQESVSRRRMYSSMWNAAAKSSGTKTESWQLNKPGGHTDDCEKCGFSGVVLAKAWLECAEERRGQERLESLLKVLRSKAQNLGFFPFTKKPAHRKGSREHSSFRSLYSYINVYICIYIVYICKYNVLYEIYLNVLYIIYLCNKFCFI